MDAPSVVNSSLLPCAYRPAHLIRWCVAVAAWSAFAACLLLVARRASGSLHPPDGSLLLGLGLLFCVATAGMRIVWRRCSLPSRSHRHRILFLLLPGLTLLMLGWSLSLPGLPAWSLIGLWLMLGVEEVAWWWIILRPPRGSPPLQPGPTRQPGPAGQGQRQSAPGSDAASGILATHQSQQLTRACDSEGVESVYGQLRGNFQQGERSQSLHVSFCPPFACAPKLFVERLEGPEVSVKLGEVQSYGVRFDLRLAKASASPTSVVIAFSAQVP